MPPRATADMAKQKKPLNPFYPLLVIAGVVFTVTACAYGVMMYLVSVDAASLPTSRLMQWMSQHGTMLIIVELAVLIFTSLAAMATDGYWTRKNQPPTELLEMQHSGETHPAPVPDDSTKH